MMKAHTSAKWTFLLVGLAILSGPARLLHRHSNPTNTASAAPVDKTERTTAMVAFNAAGELVRPSGYRTWIHTGTPLTPHDMNDGKAAFPEFHSVYIAPDAYDHYQANGTFPDGTVLVKELVSVGTKRATSGNGYFMGEFTGLEVLVKDKRRFQGEPGNWGFFSFGHEYPLKSTAKLQPTANCNACHRGAADEDFVFTQYYPVLRAAKPSAG